MIERREQSASRLNPRQPVGIAGDEIGKNLQRDVAIELESWAR